MAEEIERLKSDLKHTSSARARAESRENEVRSSLTTAEGELREARGELQVAQNDLVETREGLKSTQSELQLVREELITSRGEQWDLQAELRAVTGYLNDKEKQLEIARREASEGKVLLETARRESLEAVNSSGRLSKECRDLRTDLHQQVSMVTQMDELLLFTLTSPSLQLRWTGSHLQNYTLTSSPLNSDGRAPTIHIDKALPLTQMDELLLFTLTSSSPQLRWMSSHSTL